jgi:hypothetical protein
MPFKLRGHLTGLRASDGGLALFVAERVRVPAASATARGRSGRRPFGHHVGAVTARLERPPSMSEPEAL